jgi:hypothetical protein
VHGRSNSSRNPIPIGVIFTRRFVGESPRLFTVIPVPSPSSQRKLGSSAFVVCAGSHWIPAFAGMTVRSY